MRVKLIYHGLNNHGEPMWAPPTDDIRTCPHPPMALRYDPRYPVPCYCYCRACGQARIPPTHGMTDEQLERVRIRTTELRRAFDGIE